MKTETRVGKKERERERQYTCVIFQGETISNPSTKIPIRRSTAEQLNSITNKSSNKLGAMGPISQYEPAYWNVFSNHSHYLNLHSIQNHENTPT